MTPPPNPTPQTTPKAGAGASGGASSRTRISSDQGWHRLMHAMSRTAPKYLHLTGVASYGLVKLRTRGR